MTIQRSHLLERPGVKTLLLIAVGACLLPLWLKVPTWVSSFSVLTLLAALLPSHRIPRWVLLGFVLAATAGVWLQHRSLFTKESGLSLIVLMASFKLLELKLDRDAILLSALSFFMLFVSMLFYQSLAVSLYLFLLLPLCTAVLMAMHRLDGWLGLKRLSKDSSKFVLLALPIMLVLYVFFPRLASPLWRLPNSAMTGPTDSMTVGDVQSLVLSDELAFRARFHGAKPANADLYWRGTVLSEFDGLTWTVGSPQAADVLTEESNIVRYDVQMQPHRLRWLYALDVVRDFESEIQARRVWNAGIMTTGFVRTLSNYKAESALSYKLGVDLTERTLQHYLQLPSDGNPQSRAYAQMLANQYPDAQARVKALMTEINRRNFWYSLEVPELAEDIVDDFWFNHKRGFCEHYANAAAYILRASGIPTRVVVGYQGGEWNEYGNFLTLRHRDAHAWMEYWVAQRGWVRLDPTSAIAPQRVDQSWLDRVANRDSEFQFDAWAEYSAKAKDAPFIVAQWWQQANRWYEANVVQFNADVQKDWMKSLGLPELNKTQLVQVLVWFVLTLMTISAVIIMRSRVSRDPVSRVYALFCAKLARYGIHRKPHETPLAFLKRAQQKLPNERQRLREFIEAYLAIRYATQGSELALKRAWRKLRWRRLRAV